MGLYCMSVKWVWFNSLITEATCWVLLASLLFIPDGRDWQMVQWLCKPTMKSSTLGILFVQTENNM